MKLHIHTWSFTCVYTCNVCARRYSIDSVWSMNMCVCSNTYMAYTLCSFKMIFFLLNVPTVYSTCYMLHVPGTCTWYFPAVPGTHIMYLVPCSPSFTCSTYLSHLYLKTVHAHGRGWCTNGSTQVWGPSTPTGTGHLSIVDMWAIGLGMYVFKWLWSNVKVFWNCIGKNPIGMGFAVVT
jgi:hypothetical protein